MHKTAQYWIDRLNLKPHPEGGYYKEVFRSSHEVTRTGETQIKQACTSIYYLLEAGDYSAFHRLASDELWYFHQGSPLHIHVIDQDNALNTIELSNSETGNLQAVIPPNTWFSAELAIDTGYALVSCAVAPGFDFTEFEMASKNDMLQQYPQHATILSRLCRV